MCMNGREFNVAQRFTEEVCTEVTVKYIEWKKGKNEIVKRWSEGGRDGKNVITYDSVFGETQLFTVENQIEFMRCHLVTIWRLQHLFLFDYIRLLKVGRTPTNLLEISSWLCCSRYQFAIPVFIKRNYVYQLFTWLVDNPPPCVRIILSSEVAAVVWNISIKTT